MSLDPSKAGPLNQCVAHRRNGDRCMRSAMKGGTVCASHGGRAPQVMRRAQQRILEASDKAAYALVQMLQDEKIPPAVRVSAARDLLDRAGLTSRQELTVEVKAERSFDDIFDQVLVDVAPEDVEDAVVVEDLPAIEPFRTVDPVEEEHEREQERRRRRKVGLPSDGPRVSRARHQR